MDSKPKPSAASTLDGDIRPITFWPSKKLAVKSSPVPEEAINTEALRELVADMVSTMYATGGVGLSAIQVGIPWRLFVLDPYHNVPDHPSQLRVCVNPKLETVESSTIKMPEACLSLPGLRASVERPEKVRLICKTHLGADVDTILDSWPSRIAQHENDHLDGKLMLDHLAGLNRKQAVKRLRKFQRQVEQAEKVRMRKKKRR
jgi:peptide deformylase